MFGENGNSLLCSKCNYMLHYYGGGSDINTGDGWHEYVYYYNKQYVLNVYNNKLYGKTFTGNYFPNYINYINTFKRSSKIIEQGAY